MPTRPVAVPKQAPPFQVVGDKFTARLSGGTITVPLRFKTKLLRQIRDTDGADSLDQMFLLLDGIGDADTAAILDECDVIETLEFVRRYFEAFSEFQEATMGESPAS